NCMADLSPDNCAGSFKSEAYGVCLFQKMRGDDPTALIGLPLIKLVDFLEKAEITVI
ncbi:MAG: Maf family protein, partial [Pseudomonadota bacterium]